MKKSNTIYAHAAVVFAVVFAATQAQAHVVVQFNNKNQNQQKGHQAKLLLSSGSSAAPGNAGTGVGTEQSSNTPGVAGGAVLGSKAVRGGGAGAGHSAKNGLKVFAELVSALVQQGGFSSGFDLSVKESKSEEGGKVLTLALTSQKSSEVEGDSGGAGSLFSPLSKRSASVEALSNSPQKAQKWLNGQVADIYASANGSSQSDRKQNGVELSDDYLNDVTASEEDGQSQGSSSAVPEPATLLLLGPAMLGLMRWNNKRNT